jgi:hypothetical protein
MINSREIKGSAAWYDGKIANCRDLGGMKTRSHGPIPLRRLVRSSSFAFLPDEILADLGKHLRPGHYVDLRSDLEIARDGGLERLRAHGWEWLRLPIEDEPASTAVSSADVRKLYHRAARQILSLSPLAGPVVVACSLGKDRTGQIIALILSALGVSRDSIVRDYLQSNVGLARDAAILPRRYQADARGYTPVHAGMLPCEPLRSFPGDGSSGSLYRRFLLPGGMAEGAQS